MATLTLKNVPDGLYQRLRGAAAKNRRSLNQEAILRLDEALAEPHPEDVVRSIRAAHEEQASAGIWIDHAKTADYIREGRQ